ncbi:uncharacterized protein A1O9_08584 [Exophiala aquamarina CBS 119918]|uniref:Uncharacterized protein n=1 Tax=Exophiala aquamarina CBS 119918 TaxID=1182545 RepID=A0A072P994_9EURO|nr:uncharacterized protein A1O9_08584 [Exophiala aquamarina CBS 119918]KEF55833.1 hypothetical protein A1O9_08584 [Exophiala aquamarina CBS 119918]
MSSNNPRDIVFLPALTTNRSVRQKELIKSGVRAHTARLIHQRRKARQQREESIQPLTLNVLPASTELYENLLERSKMGLSIAGSSDPFQSFPIEITPEINHIITLARDVLLPNLYIPSFVRRLSFGVSKDISFSRAQFSIAGSAVSADLNQFKNANKGVAAAWLSGHIGFLAKLGYQLEEHDISLLELKLRQTSLRLLRGNLLSHPGEDQNNLSLAIQHIMLLFQSDCKRRDSEAASIHGPILIGLLEKLKDNTNIIQHLIVMMFGYAELAANTLGRPVITLNFEMMKRLTDFWASASSLVQITDVRYRDVHPSIDNPILRTIFTRLRACLVIAETPLPVTDTAQKARGLAVYSWIATETFNDMCVLLNLYHDLMEGQYENKTSGECLTEACIALTLLHTLRKCIHEAEMDGKDLRDTSPVIMPRLRKHLESAIETLISRECAHYAQVYLWMFSVGAQNEQRDRLGSENEEPKESSLGWFNDMLADQAQYLNITTWHEARTILECFVHDRHQIPDGNIWFEQSINRRQTDIRMEKIDVTRADSHKDKEWQPYAAAAAAAYLKGLLSAVPVQEGISVPLVAMVENEKGLDLVDALDMGEGLFISRKGQLKEMGSFLEPHQIRNGSTRPYKHGNDYNDTTFYAITLDPFTVPSFDIPLPIPSPLLSLAVRPAEILDSDIIIGTIRDLTS